MSLEQKIKNALFKKWQVLICRSNAPLYFYVISQNNNGWGFVIPEMLGVIKHSITNNYRVCFIANPGSHINTLKLFDSISEFETWARYEFIHFAGLDFYARQLGASIGSTDQLRNVCLNNSEFNNLFPKIPAFHWPFGDLLRCFIHNTEFVHPDFVLSQSDLTFCTHITRNGINSRNLPLKLKDENMIIANELLGVDNSPRFVLSLRVAPAYHGTDRDTEPEELDQLLQEAAKFTNKIDLIGTNPGKELIFIINKYAHLIKFTDHTFDNYEVKNYSQTDSNVANKHLINTYLLATSNIKMLPPSGIICYPSASGQFYGVFNTPNIFYQDQYHMISCPRRFNQMPNFSPLKAFAFGLTTLHDGDWFLERIPASPDSVFSAIENLLNQFISKDPNYLHTESIFNPRLLNTIRKELVFATKIFEHADLKSFGQHLIQDTSGLPIRYS